MQVAKSANVNSCRGIAPSPNRFASFTLRRGRMRAHIAREACARETTRANSASEAARTWPRRRSTRSWTVMGDVLWRVLFAGFPAECRLLRIDRQGVGPPPPSREHHWGEDSETRRRQASQHGVDFVVGDQPLGDGLLAHLREVGGIKACPKAAALAYRDVPFHADFGKPSGLELAVETARPFYLQAPFFHQPP